MNIKAGQIWKSKITGGEVEVIYHEVAEWVGVKILGTTMLEPYVEISSKAFGTNLELITDIE